MFDPSRSLQLVHRHTSVTPISFSADRNQLSVDGWFVPCRDRKSCPAGGRARQFDQRQLRAVWRSMSPIVVFAPEAPGMALSAKRQLRIGISVACRFGSAEVSDGSNCPVILILNDHHCSQPCCTGLESGQITDLPETDDLSEVVHSLLFAFM